MDQIGVEPARALFACAHLPVALQAVSARFEALATFLFDEVPPGVERAIALRKLLEAKDAAVRAALPPRNAT